MLKKAWLVFLPLVLIASLARAEFTEGVDYIAISPAVKTADPSKVVVTEVFWYGCPHCFRFEPYIETWKKTKPDGVLFEQVPSVLNPSWMNHARAYFALDMMGETERTHRALFNALHLKNMRLNSVDTLAKFVADLGLDEKQFRDNFHSFQVDTQVRKLRQTEKKYGHTGVPAVIVNGKYRTSGSQAGSNARMIEVINYLVAKELAAQ